MVLTYIVVTAWGSCFGCEMVGDEEDEEDEEDDDDDDDDNEEEEEEEEAIQDGRGVSTSATTPLASRSPRWGLCVGFMRCHRAIDQAGGEQTLERLTHDSYVLS